MSLGHVDEPQDSGAIVAVNWGDYRTQEIWQRGGASDTWVCLGNEFGRPKPWDDPRTELEKISWRWGNVPAPQPGPGEVKRWARWSDVLERGPVALLVPGQQDAYAAGWVAGRRDLLGQMEGISEDGPPAGSWAGGSGEEGDPNA